MIAIIVNPHAGKHDKKSVVNSLKHYAEASNTPYTLLYSQRPMQIVDLAASAALSGCERLIVAGGDGSIQEAVEGLSRSNWPCPVAVIPCGTGNDLAKSLNIPTDIDEAVKVAFTGQVVPLTLGTMNEHFFANITSTGLDADITALRTKLKPIIAGPLAYLVATVLTIIRYRPTKYQLNIDGRQIEGEYALIAVANGKYYGGGMQIAPHADPTHPDFNVVAVKGLKPLKLLSLLHLVYSGKHVDTPHVEEYYGSHIKITSNNRSIAINYDGELTHSNILEAKRIEGGSSRIIVPGGGQ